MIDPEKLLALSCGVLLAALVILALCLVSEVDWSWWAEQGRRFAKWLRVTWEQYATDAERKAAKWTGRGLWVWLLVYVAWRGW